MKNNIIYVMSFLACIATSCDDYNDHFDGLDEMVKKASQDIKSLELNLDECYSSTDDANKAIIAKLAKDYPTADNGSSVKVTYNLATNAPDFLSQITSAQTYTVTDDSYSNIWNGENVGYFTPSKLATTYLPSILKDTFRTAVDGDRVLVTYNFSNIEPTTSGEKAKETTWMALEAPYMPSGTSWNYTNTGEIDLSDYVGQKIRIGMRYKSTAEAASTIEIKQLSVSEPSNYANPYLFYLDTKNNVYKISNKPSVGSFIIACQVDVDKYVPFGRIKEDKNYGYCVGDTICATKGTLAIADVENYIISIDSTANGVSIKNSIEKYLYLSGTYDSFNVNDALQTEGSDWNISLNDDGTISIKNVTNNKTVKYDRNYKSFGAYADEKLNITTYFNNSLLGTDLPSDFSLIENNLPAELTSVWTFTDNYGFKASAFANSTNYESESWIVTPEIDLSAAIAPVVATNIAGQYFGAGRTADDCIKLFVTTDYDETATWNTGNKAATLNYEQRFALYQFNGTKWIESTDAVVVNPADYNAMGSNYSNFSSTLNPDIYLPKFLSANFPYAVGGQEKVIVYNYYDSSAKTTNITADIYSYNDTIWTKTLNIESITSQFVRTGGTWIFDPSVVLNYPRDGAETANFFQICTDWVWANIDTQLGCTTKGQGYVTSYANNEYYSGCSAYQKDVDWRPAKARDQYASGFTGNDADDIALMQQHLIEVFKGVLEQQYSDAKTIDDVNIFYTINFVAYDGANHNYTIKFKLVADGQFEYVKDSLSEAE